MGGSSSNTVRTSNLNQLDEDTTYDDWEAFDKEEEEDNIPVSSVSHITSINDANMNHYPNIIIPIPPTQKKKSKNKNSVIIDTILQRLLPIVQIIIKNSNEHKDKAKVAVEIKEKREAMKLKRKNKDDIQKKRNGYYY